MQDQKRILAVEPYYGGSHKTWIDGWIKRSHHRIELITLPARKWKWRMRGAAIELANRFAEIDDGEAWDGLIASDMLNLAEFIALTRPAFDVCPSVLYLHENQFSYPLHPDERVDYHYILTNFISSLAATKVVFNSEYNRDDFFGGIGFVLNKMPDFVPDQKSLQRLREDSYVLPPCVALPTRNRKQHTTNSSPVILWNHRWDRDKQPDVFLAALQKLVKRGIDFQVIICGERFDSGEICFQDAQSILGDGLIHLGYVESWEKYQAFLQRSDIVVSTAMQEFFGISVVEAVYAGAFPVLPKRLNYPHLIPKAFHELALYEEDGFIDHLQRVIELAKNQPLPDLSEHMEQYKWEHHIQQYDALFDE